MDQPRLETNDLHVSNIYNGMVAWNGQIFRRSNLKTNFVEITINGLDLEEHLGDRSD